MIGAHGQTVPKHVVMVSRQDQGHVRLILSGVEPMGPKKLHAILLPVRFSKRKVILVLKLF